MKPCRVSCASLRGDVKRPIVCLADMQEHARPSVCQGVYLAALYAQRAGVRRADRHHWTQLRCTQHTHTHTHAHTHSHLSLVSSACLCVRAPVHVLCVVVCGCVCARVCVCVCVCVCPHDRRGSGHALRRDVQSSWPCVSIRLHDRSGMQAVGRSAYQSALNACTQTPFYASHRTMLFFHSMLAISM